MTPADIILSQLGGRSKLSLTIGAKDFFSDDNGSALVFKIGGGAKNAIKYINIRLNIMDTYDVIFSKSTRKKDKKLNIFISGVEEVSKYEGIYYDGLKNLIEEETGFYLAPL
jgi:hypothetical protein